MTATVVAPATGAPALVSAVAEASPAESAPGAAVAGGSGKVGRSRTIGPGNTTWPVRSRVAPAAPPDPSGRGAPPGCALPPGPGRRNSCTVPPSSTRSATKPPVGVDDQPLLQRNPHPADYTAPGAGEVTAHRWATPGARTARREVKRRPAPHEPRVNRPAPRSGNGIGGAVRWIVIHDDHQCTRRIRRRLRRSVGPAPHRGPSR